MTRGGADQVRASAPRWMRTAVIAALGSIAFLVYFTSVDLNARNFYEHNFVFDADIKRVVKVLTEPSFVHDIEAHRHPLFEILLKAPARLSAEIFDDPRRSSLALTALFGAIAVTFAFIIFEKISASIIDAILFSIVFASSASVWLFFAVPESFAINCAAIVIAFYLQCIPMKQSGVLLASGRHAIFGTLATGITVTNSAYAVLSYANLVRNWNASWKWVLLLTTVYALVVLNLLEGLSWIQHRLYEDAWLFTGMPSFFEQLLENDWHYVRNMNMRSAGGIGELLRTYFLDGIVAPSVEARSFIAFSDPWIILTFKHRVSFLYALTIAAYAGFVLLCLGSLFRAGRYREPDVQLAAAFVAFGCAVGLAFSTVGVPLIYAVHVVFPFAYLTMAGYTALAWRGKRLFLLIFTILLVQNSAQFIGDTNTYLREAEGLGVEYPPE